jgi:hypothetical protein
MKSEKKNGPDPSAWHSYNSQFGPVMILNNLAGFSILISTIEYIDIDTIYRDIRFIDPTIVYVNSVISSRFIIRLQNHIQSS